MKKILMTLPVFAFAMAFAASASATYYHHRSSDDLNVRSSNYADIENDVEATSDSGDNRIRGGRGDNTILTGRADSLATSETEANSNGTDLSGVNCNCFDDVTVRSNNRAYVDNDVEAKSDSGDNSIRGGGHSMPSARSLNVGGHSRGGGDNLIDTGDAIATADSWTLVNSNVTRW